MGLWARMRTSPPQQARRRLDRLLRPVQRNQQDGLRAGQPGRLPRHPSRHERSLHSAARLDFTTGIGSFDAAVLEHEAAVGTSAASRRNQVSRSPSGELSREEVLSSEACGRRACVSPIIGAEEAADVLVAGFYGGAGTAVRTIIQVVDGRDGAQAPARGATL